MDHHHCFCLAFSYMLEGRQKTDAGAETIYQLTKQEIDRPQN